MHRALASQLLVTLLACGSGPVHPVTHSPDSQNVAGRDHASNLVAKDAGAPVIPISGIYGQAEIAVDRSRQLITVAYRNGRGEPDARTGVPPFTCGFMVAARLNGGGPTYDALPGPDPHRSDVRLASFRRPISASVTK